MTNEFEELPVNMKISDIYELVDELDIGDLQIIYFEDLERWIIHECGYDPPLQYWSIAYSVIYPNKKEHIFIREEFSESKMHEDIDRLIKKYPNFQILQKYFIFQKSIIGDAFGCDGKSNF